MCNFNMSIFKKENYIKHSMEAHNKIVAYYPVCDWVLFKPAGGYFKMNSIKAFFELNWEPYLSKLCFLMGYKTDAAQFIAKKCKDHHQAWELLLIIFVCLFVLLREFVLYIREEIQPSNQPNLSAEEFLSFTSRKKSNPNHIHLCRQITIYPFAIINFWMAQHRNNIKLAQSAVCKLSDVFYRRNYPFY